jgi:hypothetical protein
VTLRHERENRDLRLKEMQLERFWDKAARGHALIELFCEAAVK